MILGVELSDFWECVGRTSGSSAPPHNFLFRIAIDIRKFKAIIAPAQHILFEDGDSSYNFKIPLTLICRDTHTLPLLALHPPYALAGLNESMGKVIKRLFDILFAAIIIVALAPVWILLALWIALTSPGGVFFRQARTGLDGRTFYMYKFRSMYVNDEADTLQSVAGDKRITRAGRFLRRTSLDELPQLLNVLKGDMSIIGPRPHMLAHTEYYSQRIPDYMKRHRMRPGLTGYAQVRGYRGATPTLEDMQRRVDADNYYIDRFSLWMDLRIFTLTLWKMLTFKL